MTEQLLPDFHLKIRHRKADQTPICNSGIRCVIREKRAACPLRYQLTEQLCIAGLQQRLDLQAVRREDQRLRFLCKPGVSQ